MSAQQRVGSAADLPPGTVVGVGRYAVGNAGGRYFAVTRRCRHLGADLAAGSLDERGCLVCPWHHSAYDVTTGRMVRGPQGAWAKVPGLDFGYRMLTRVLPLGRAPVTERDGDLYLAGKGQLQGGRADRHPVRGAQGSGRLGGELTKTRSTDVTETTALPEPDQPVSFAAHIMPLFRERDRQAMSWAFDLGSYDDVRAHAETILDRLAAGRMPCDGAWPAERVEIFRRWTQTGTQA